MKIRIFLSVLLVCVYGSAAGGTLDAPRTVSREVAVEGRVCDTAGAPIAGAKVQLETTAGTVVASSLADTSGRYRLRATTDEILRIRAQRVGFHDAVIPVEEKRIDIVLEKVAASIGIEFSDSPDYTVAGVADWSNVALHGSGANVRTGESLAKEAAALKSGTVAAASRAITEGDKHRRLGDEKEENGEPIAAVQEYSAAVRLDPSEENYFALGSEFVLHRDGLTGAEIFTKAIAKYPTSLRLREALGAAYYINGQFAEAAAALCRAADLNSADLTPYLFLGKMEDAPGDLLPCSQQKLAQFAKDHPENPRANFYYGLVLWKDGRKSQKAETLSKAESLFRRSLKLDPSQSDVYVKLGLLLISEGRLDSAVAALQKAVSTAPNVSDAHFQLSLAYRRSGQKEKADTEMAQYQAARKTEEAALEKQHKEMKQFVTTLKNAPPN